MELLLATGNKKKLAELKEILKGMPFTFHTLADVDNPPEVIENGATFKENAAKKAVQNARHTGMLTLGEDSGLCVDALGGKPGIYSARFAGSQKSDEKNNAKLLRLLKGVPAPKRRAYYVCAVAIADASGLIAVVEGKCSGRIGLEPKGTSGFGYDPLFVIPKYHKTFAELGEGIKHTMSHRFRALVKAKKALQKYIEKHGQG